MRWLPLLSLVFALAAGPDANAQSQVPGHISGESSVLVPTPSPATNDPHSVSHAGLAARSDHFVLLSDAPVDGVAILSDLEAFRVAVLSDLGLEARHDAPLTLTLTGDLELFEAISPGGITAAIYLQSVAGSDIVVGHSTDPDHLLGDALDPGWLRLVLRHEVVHHIIEAHYPRKLPIWLGEGLAEYYATFDPDPDGLAVFGRALPEQDPLSELDRWLPMRTVIESMARYPDYAASAASGEPLFRAQQLYYGQSWALAQFVMDQPEGLARIHRFVDSLSDTSDSEDSFEAEFGMRYGPLEDRVRAGLARGDSRLRVARMAAPGPRTLSREVLRPRVRDANRLRLLLSYGRDDARTDALIAMARARVETAPDGINAAAALALGRAEALHGWRRKDWSESDRHAARLLAEHPADPVALKIRAKSAYGRVSDNQTDDALWSAARQAAVRALAVRPDDAQLHLFRVAVSLPDENGLPAPARASLDTLIADDVHLRLPHEAMMMIPALIYQGRLDHADRVLDNAARWTDDRADRFVIERLRDNVAMERARGR